MGRERTANVSLQVEAAYRRCVERRQLRLAAEKTLLHQQAGPGAALTLVITGDEQVRALNRQYRGVDAPTDVLAFAARETTGDDFANAPGALAYLGDVIISYPRAEAHAQAAGHPVQAELQLLVVHGVLHLLGHDHARAAQRRAMWAAQADILQLLGLPITPE